MAIKTLTKTFKIVVDGPVSAEMQNLMSPYIINLDELINILYRIHGLVSYHTYKTSINIYKYKFIFADGSVWDQEINVTNPNDITILTVMLTGAFKLSTIDLIRRIRENTVSLLLLNQYLTDMEITYA